MSNKPSRPSKRAKRKKPNDDDPKPVKETLEHVEGNPEPVEGATQILEPRPLVPHKTAAYAKEAIALAFEGLGGVKELVAWATKSAINQRIFYTKIFPKLITHRITIGGDGPAAQGIALHLVERPDTRGFPRPIETPPV